MRYDVMKRKTLLMLLISIVLSILMEVLAWIVTPPSIPHTVVPADAKNLYSSIEYDISGYDWADSWYEPNNEDPQIRFDFPGYKIETIIIEFKEPLSQNVPIQLYYAKNGDDLNEKNHVEVVAEQGSKDIIITLPQDIYTCIRTDINGPFALEGIYVSVEKPQITYSKSPLRLNTNRLFLVCAVLFAVFYFSCKDSVMNIHWAIGRNLQKLKPRESVLVITAFLIMGVLILLQVNNSSMACYRTVIPNNIQETSQLILGWPRSIRSDEFLVGTPAFFHNQVNGQLVERVFDQNSDSIIIWINNVITMLNPYYWGELCLPTAYAFSWRFVLNSAFLIWIYYKLFVIFTGSKPFSIVASLLIVFSPAIQWWSQTVESGIMCGFVVFFYDFFCARKAWKKVLCAWGLVCCTSTIVPLIYPAWGIPLAYLFLFILVGIYATQKKIDFKKTDVPYIAVTCLLMIVVVVAYFVSSGDATQSMLETIYPGKRFSTGGGLQSSYWAHYLAAPLIPWKTENMVLNQSELSHFLHLFPIPIAIFIAKYQDFKANKVMKALVGFNILCDVYMIFGVGDFIAKYTLLSYTTSRRLHIIWGLSSFILLLLECYYIVPKRPKQAGKIDWTKCIFVNGCIATFLIWVVVSQISLIDYIEAGNFVYISAGIILLGNLLFWGKKKVFIAIICILTVVSGFVANPINFGSSIMTDTPLAEEIREIDRQDSGRWVALNDIMWMPKYVYAQGVDCINYLSWPPRFDLFAPVDENGEYRDIYNRYAHVGVYLTTEETSFVLNSTDSLAVFLNVDDLEKWDVKYVVILGEIPEQMGHVKFQLLYYDTLDNMNIYKVSYYHE